MSKLFVSYRRTDSSDVTGRVFDRLKARFGAESLFKDVDSIPKGVDFRRVIKNAVGECGVLLAVIGPDWLTAVNDKGIRRLDDPGDYVTLEISAALERDIPVIPVLVENARMPTAEQLPASLQALAFRNAAEVHADPYFHYDMDQLCNELDRMGIGGNHARRFWGKHWGKVALATIAVIGVWWAWFELTSGKKLVVSKNVSLTPDGAQQDPDAEPRVEDDRTPVSEGNAAARASAPRAEKSDSGELEADGRVLVTDTRKAPYNAVCRLEITTESGTEFRASGVLVAPQLVITARSALDSGLGKVPELIVCPGLAAGEKPFGSYRSRDVRVQEESVASADSIGAVFLEAPVKDVEALPLDALTDAQLLSSDVSIPGYPADKGGKSMWVASGRLFEVTPTLLQYRIQTSPGVAGAPLLAKRESSASHAIVGIHCSAGPKGKSAVRITPAQIELIHRWILESTNNAE